MSLIYSHIYHSPIGAMLIQANEHSISNVQFIEDQQLSALELEPTETNPIIHKCIDELIEYFGGQRMAFTVPIHQEGTEFQQKVWKELYEVPFGKTLSYGELAKKLGDPKCVRAAASANGKNKIAVLIPCHRIIGADQSLVGYAWGKSRKRWLLQHEFRLALGVQTLF
jgi:methylated-DNA-[protein]-cysteine S-methyltransferase